MASITASSTTLKVPSLDYTSRDYESTRHDLINLIPFFCPEWTNHNATDPGITHIELFSAIMDILHFYIDRRAAEGFLSTAISRQSVINLLKIIGFEVLASSPSVVDLTFTLASVLSTDLVIPKGTQVTSAVSTGEVAQTFETESDLTIPAGQLSGSVSSRHGETKNEQLDASDGTSFQEFTLPDTNIVQGTIRLFIQETSLEEEWIEISNLSNATADQKVFQVVRKDDESFVVELGDQAQGRIPVSGASIRSEYIVGGGAVGLLPANKLTVLKSTILHQGQPVSLSVNNASAATGGEDEMSIEEAKLLGPRSLQANNRAVTEADMETFALEVGGVLKAKAIPRLPAVRRIVDIFIAPAGGGQPAQSLLDSVVSYVSARKIAGVNIVALPAKYVEVDIVGTVFVLPNFVQNDVNTSVTLAIDSFFSLDNVDNNFGTGANLSDIFSSIDGVDGVDHVDLDRASLNPNSTIVYDVWTGDASFSTILITSTTKDETWTLIFTSANTFSLSGSVSGTQGNTGTIGVAYSSDNNEISFTLSNSGNPMVLADRAVFRTSKLLGNSNINTDELRIKGTVTLSFSGGA